MIEIKSGYWVRCLEDVKRVDGSCSIEHEQGQVYKVSEGEDVYYNHPCNRKMYKIVMKEEG